MDRVESMALIHDTLYRSENLASIYFPGYVNDRVRGLIANYAVGKSVKLDLQVDPTSFNIDNAIPLGSLSTSWCRTPLSMLSRRKAAVSSR